MNPKLAGSSIVDCIPQTGECPLSCEECFYNGGRFYRTLDSPLIPTQEEAEGKIVRMNSGHDSNIQRSLVIQVAQLYKDKFFNTAIPRFDFPGPVVFTCNSRALIRANPPTNLMAVRVRVATWDLHEVYKAVDWYALKHRVPVILTFMRFFDKKAVQRPEDYEWRKSVLNEYWCIKREEQTRVMETFRGTGVRSCGTLASAMCADCRNCEFLYREWTRKTREECIC